MCIILSMCIVSYCLLVLLQLNMSLATAKQSCVCRAGLSSGHWVHKESAWLARVDVEHSNASKAGRSSANQPEPAE